MSFKKLFNQPSFWKTKNIPAVLLLPIAFLYSLISKVRYKLQKPKKYKAVVVCIGGASIGGSGKTPLAIAFGSYLKQTFPKLKIVYACRNYNGIVQGPILVQAGYSHPGIIDEALLLAKTLPVVVARNRLAAIEHACGVADIVISDDGFQNNSFHKDLSVLAVPNDKSFGNGLIFPAGPMRENLSSAAKRADMAFLMNRKAKSHAASCAILKNCFSKTKVFDVQYKLSFILVNKTIAEQSLRGKKLVAFCSVANPQRFFDQLKGLNVVDCLTFPDHYSYSNEEGRCLLRKAKELGSTLITTEKDIVKFSAAHQKQIIWVKILPVLPKTAQQKIKRAIIKLA